MDLKIFLKTSKNKRKNLFKWDMDLVKKGLLFKHHYTTKVKKTWPHSNLDSRKEWKALGQD